MQWHLQTMLLGFSFRLQKAGCCELATGTSVWAEEEQATWQLQMLWECEPPVNDLCFWDLLQTHLVYMAAL